MAVEQLKTQELLTKPSEAVIRRCLVIGGGISGLTSALFLAEQGFGVDLIEKTEELGGHSRDMYFAIGADNPQAFVKSILEKVKANPKITVHLNSEIITVSGYAGNYRSQVKPADGNVVEVSAWRGDYCHRCK